jgi:MFS-type transporter involved in bile tolerance (Atg22 family)
VATIPAAAMDRLQAVGLQAAIPTAVQAVMSPLAQTTGDPKATKVWLTIAAMIVIRCAIMTVTMDEPLRATMTIGTMVIVTIAADISSTVCGSGMAPRMLLTTAAG